MVLQLKAAPVMVTVLIIRANFGFFDVNNLVSI